MLKPQTAAYVSTGIAVAKKRTLPRDNLGETTATPPVSDLFQMAL